MTAPKMILDPAELAEAVPADLRSEVADKWRAVLDTLPPSTDPADRLSDARARFAIEATAVNLDG